MIEEYLGRVKDLWLKLYECQKYSNVRQINDRNVHDESKDML